MAKLDLKQIYEIAVVKQKVRANPTPNNQALPAEVP